NTSPDGAPLPLAVQDPGLSSGTVAAPAIGLRLDSGNLDRALLLLVPHGAAPCLGGPSCGAIAFPVAPFVARYASPMGGSTGAGWSGHQVSALFGRPPTAGEDAASVLRLGIFDAAIPSPP